MMRIDFAACFVFFVMMSTKSWVVLADKNSINISATTTSPSTNFTFAVSPISLNNPFYTPTQLGCEAAAAQYAGVTCLFVGSYTQNPTEQAGILLQYIRSRTIDGLALSVADPTVLTPVINEAVAAGIPVITFDSDAADSNRTLFIGTDNYELGFELGNIVKTVLPFGGTFAVIGTSHPNIVQRQQGVQDSLASNMNPNVNWIQVRNSPSDALGDPTRAMMQVELFAEHYPNLTTIISCMGAPMRSGGWAQFVQQYPNITLFSGDAMPNQMAFLNTGYVSGLVGQLPYDEGKIAIEVLYAMAAQGQTFAGTTYIRTNILQHVRIPLVLPPLQVNNNLIGNLRVVGFVLFGIVVVTATSFASWMYINRKVRVVRVSQPMFLILVAVGVVIMTSSMIPLSFDDSDHVNTTASCMSIPWLTFTGFSTTFSALFAKTWRVNRIFRSKRPFQRIEISAQQVIAPLFLLLGANWIILSCWTAIDPLTYVRLNHPGTDAWGRIIATYGVCQSRNAVAFMVPLAVINFGIMAIANWQAYEARVIQFEFSESKHIALAMGSFLQATLLGIPLLFVVRESPQAYYLILTFLLFIIGMAILVVIFVPKMIFAEECRTMSDNVQTHLIRQSIHRSQQAAQQARNNSGSGSLEASRSLFLEKSDGSFRPFRVRRSVNRVSETNNSWAQTPSSQRMQDDDHVATRHWDENGTTREVDEAGGEAETRTGSTVHSSMEQTIYEDQPHFDNRNSERLQMLRESPISDTSV